MGGCGMTVRLRYIDRFTDRHGKVRHYFRRPGGARIPLPDPSDPGFIAAYQAALDGQPAAAERVKGAPGTFDRLLFEYFRSPDFLRQKKSSQTVTRRILEAFAKEHGGKRVATMPRKAVVHVIGQKSATPAAANNLLKKLRSLIRFGIANGYRPDDPTIGIKRFKEGTHHSWTEQEIAKFEARWPVGSRERTAFALALFTGQRRADIASMTWAAYDAAAGLIEVVQEKTGTPLTIPVHRDLRSALASWPREHVVILTTSLEKPFSVAGFGNWFADAIAKAGLPKRCVLHGLRKAAARRLADIGCSTHEIASITGHASLEEVERYTKQAEQKRLARSAVARLEEHYGDRIIPNHASKPDKIT
jgi:integrase